MSRMLVVLPRRRCCSPQRWRQPHETAPSSSLTRPRRSAAARAARGRRRPPEFVGVVSSRAHRGDRGRVRRHGSRRSSIRIGPARRGTAQPMAPSSTTARSSSALADGQRRGGRGARPPSAAPRLDLNAARHKRGARAAPLRAGVGRARVGARRTGRRSAGPRRAPWRRRPRPAGPPRRAAAELERQLAQATVLTAPFDGVVDRPQGQRGRARPNGHRGRCACSIPTELVVRFAVRQADRRQPGQARHPRRAGHWPTAARRSPARSSDIAPELEPPTSPCRSRHRRRRYPHRREPAVRVTADCRIARGARR